MIANALVVTIAVLLGVAFYLMGELRFLASYRVLLLREYGWALAMFFGGLFVNVFAAVFVFIRKFLLKDTGRKLSHIDKQFHFAGIEMPPDETK
jgi:hypothetical protein